MSVRKNAGVFSICFVTQQRIGETLGGVQTSIWRMIKWLRAKPIAFMLVFPKLRGLVGVVSVLDSERGLVSGPQMATSWDRLPHVNLASLFWAMVAALRIVCANSTFRFSVVHAFGYRSDGIAALIASRLLRIPYSVHVKGPGIHLKDLLPTATQRILRNLEYPMSLFVLEKASLILCESEEGRRSVLRHIADTAKVQLSPPSILIDDYDFPVAVGRKVREDLGVRTDDVVIGYVGRLSPGKNIEALMRAYGSVRRLTGSSCKLLIIGSGPLERELKRLAQEIGIGNDVLFLGTRYDVSALLQAIDIFVIPSFFEGYSNALLEAMAAGKAIVASDIPGNREILGKDGGLLFNPNDTHALGGILVRLISNSGLRAEKGLKACRLAKRYGLDEVCQDFLRKLGSMVTSPT